MTQEHREESAIAARIPAVAVPSCREINVRRLVPGPQSRATIVRLRLSSP